MYRFYINHIKNINNFAELIRIFIPEDEFEAVPVELRGNVSGLLGENSYFLNAGRSEDADEVKRELYHLLVMITDRRPEWGSLTGVRPLKLARSIFLECGDLGKTKEAMMRNYLISPEKADLLNEILSYQAEYIAPPDSSMSSLYVGIPFCPTKCSYCAFGSDVASDRAIRVYFPKLLEEVKYTGAGMLKSRVKLESIYFGGGTPTTLSAGQLAELFSTVSESFRTELSSVETTVEAGRPDTIDPERLEAIRSAGVSRISINPQSMKDETLKAIGREHTSADIEAAFRTAADFGFEVINSDLIAGLPGEEPSDMRNSLEKIIGLGANNITIHTLSIKRGSRMRESDPGYFRRNRDTVVRMLDLCGNILRSAGFRPYYIYRQKHQMGALENIGWCLPGKHSIYNVRIMEEKQTIIGLGAGAIGKIYYPDDDRLVRVPNINDHRMYVERFDEMLKRKDRYFGG